MTQEKQQLMDCPFKCGGRLTKKHYPPRIIRDLKHFPAKIKIVCGMCEGSTGNFETDEQAIKAWNTRAKPNDTKSQVSIHSEKDVNKLDCRKEFEEWYIGYYGALDERYYHRELVAYQVARAKPLPELLGNPEQLLTKTIIIDAMAEAIADKRTGGRTLFNDFSEQKKQKYRQQAKNALKVYNKLTYQTQSAPLPDVKEYKEGDCRTCGLSGGGHEYCLECEPKNWKPKRK